MKKHEVLAVIPARGNSKTIPNKNIKDFVGFPLIAYSIAAATQSEYVTRTIVSTDQEAIKDIAMQYGAEVPFMRPARLALDATTDFPVFQHALEWLNDIQSYHPDMVVQLRPTSPVRSVGLVDEAVQILMDHPQADAVRGVIPAGQNPYKMWRLAEDGHMQPVLSVEGISESYNAPRQHLPNVYWQTGHIDVIRTATILEKHSMSGDVIFPQMIESKFAVDIDTPLDWERAERLVKEGNLAMVTPRKNVRKYPRIVKLLVLDFDGVMTDDRVWINESGLEMVAASRSDGMGLELLRKKTDIQVVVISKESNPVVSMRCKKLKIPVYQNINDKKTTLDGILKKIGIDPCEAVFIGNDVNDLPCFGKVGFAAVPNDAYLAAKLAADVVLEKNGGYGAVREMADILIEKYGK